MNTFPDDAGTDAPPASGRGATETGRLGPAHVTSGPPALALKAYASSLHDLSHPYWRLTKNRH